MIIAECTRQEEDLTLIGICFVMVVLLSNAYLKQRKPQEQEHPGVKAEKRSATVLETPTAVSHHATQVGVRMTDTQLRLCYIRLVLLKSCQIVMTVSPQVMN